MLAIRLQRRGRKGHAQFRVVVQESQLSPKSGRVVANLGNYDPHTKVANLDTEKAEYYLSNGAQPSNTVAKLFDNNKIKLPDWVEVTRTQERTIRNAEKLRKNQPAEEEAPAEEAAPEASADDAEAPAEEAAEEAPAEEKAEETPAEEAPEEAPAEEADADDKAEK